MTGYSASMMRNVTRKARRTMSRGDWRLRNRRGVLRACAVMRSSSLRGFFAEQSAWLEDQDQHQQRKHDRLGPLGIEHTVRDGRDDADEHTAHKRALDVADAAHDGRRKRVQTAAEALK